MVQMIEANWLAFALALVIGLIVAWWLFARGSKGPERSHRPDVLDEGVAPAQRNQALIDAPSAAAAAMTPPPMAGAMAGIGEVIGVAARDEVEAAEAAAPPAATPVAPAAASGEADDLRRIKGIGPKLATLLGTLGVTRFDQIAAWDDAEIDRIDAQLGTFAGRIRRDSWVEQAGYLAGGDVAGFEARFGKV
jgi:predicted flap endonuclease-1-like 5' DNA nuclease